MQAPSTVFAYGTLMTGECQHRLFEPATIKSVKPASLSGVLHDFGDYPGLVLTSTGGSRVYGELIELEALDSVIDSIDAEEGPEFRREIVTVDDQFAWVWVLVSEHVNTPVIPSGYWRSRNSGRLSTETGMPGPDKA